MLRSDWVETIHARLLVRYGDAWLRKWDGIDRAAVEQDWAEELHGLTSGAIAHALSNLPPARPPNSAEFKALALMRPEPMPVALPAPKADPSRVAAFIAGMRKQQKRDTLAWAYALKERDEKHGGVLGCRKPMTLAARRMYRDALASGSSTEAA